MAYDTDLYCSVEELNQKIRAAEEHVKQLKEKRLRQWKISGTMGRLAAASAYLAIVIFMIPAIIFLPTPVGWVMLGFIILFAVTMVPSLALAIIYSNKSEKITKNIQLEEAELSKMREAGAPAGRLQAIEKALNAFLNEERPAAESYKKLIAILRQELQGCASADDVIKMKGHFWQYVKEFYRAEAVRLYPPQGDDRRGELQMIFEDQKVASLKAKVCPELDELYDGLVSPYYQKLERVSVASGSQSSEKVCAEAALRVGEEQRLLTRFADTTCAQVDARVVAPSTTKPPVYPSLYPSLE